MVNRQYIDSATSHGTSEDSDLLIALGFPQRTIFQDLDEAGNVTWRNYFELVPATWQMSYSRSRLGNFRFYNQSFAADVARGDLANYSAWSCARVCCRVAWWWWRGPWSSTAVSRAEHCHMLHSHCARSTPSPRTCCTVAVPALTLLCSCRFPAFIDPRYYDFLGWAPVVVVASRSQLPCARVLGRVSVCERV
jgi:hypothetical protein